MFMDLMDLEEKCTKHFCLQYTTYFTLFIHQLLELSGCFNTFVIESLSVVSVWADMWTVSICCYLLLQFCAR